jgi:hypothetical protein
MRPKLLDVAQEWTSSFNTDANPKMFTYLNSNSYGIANDNAKSFRQRAVQECLDVLGSLRSHRAPVFGEAWYIPASAERRMLAQVAAVLVLGPFALDFVEQAAIDADIPDADRVFSAIFLLGSAAGRSYIKRCIPIYEAALHRNREEAAAAIEALCLCPNPNLAESLSPLLTHASPVVRAATIRVMGYRNELFDGQWGDAVVDVDQRVVLAALSVPLQQLNRRYCDVTLEPLYSSSQEALVHAALRAGLALGLAKTQEAARLIARNSPAWAHTLSLLAFAGSREDQALFDHALSIDLPSAAEACGRAGWLQLGSKLLVAYKAQSTGHSNDEVLGNLVKAALVAIVPLPEDTPVDAHKLTQAWLECTYTLDAKQRYRNGHVWDANALINQLREGQHLRPQRQELFFELQVLTKGQAPRFSAFDFIGAQLDALDRISATVGNLPSSVASVH